MKNCPCYSKKEYINCCHPLHLGASPKNALNLMRSRFAAYHLGLFDYIINTTHSESPKYNENLVLWEKNILDFSSNTKFENLIIHEYLAEPEEIVTFTAKLIQNHKDVSFTEKSIFKLEDGRLKYFKGIFL